MNKEQTGAVSASRELRVSRLINAPVALVFEAWTNPEHIKHWWGPNGFTHTIYKMDVKPGGAWEFTMHGPDGANYESKQMYVEIVTSERIVMKHPAAGYEMTVDFVPEEGNKTRVDICNVFESAEVLAEVIRRVKADEGLAQNADRMKDYVEHKMPAERELVIIRRFDAPQELIFKALTEPERFAQWWGPAGGKVEIVQFDLRPGGICHYSMKNEMGEMWGRFEYREIVPQEKLVFISAFSDKEGNIARPPFMRTWTLEILNTLVLLEHEGKTTLLIKGKPINATAEEVKNFEAMLDNMQIGFAGTFDTLEKYLAGAQ
jgi:uncharacterized protein YndB with AHSA1/START domain